MAKTTKKPDHTRTTMPPGKRPYVRRGAADSMRADFGLGPMMPAKGKKATGGGRC